MKKQHLLLKAPWLKAKLLLTLPLLLQTLLLLLPTLPHRLLKLLLRLKKRSNFASSRQAKLMERSSPARVAAFSFLGRMKMTNRLAALIPLLLIAACDAGSDGAATGGLTAGEVEQLEKAADRLDARAPSPAADQAAALEADVRARLEEERAELDKR